MRNMKELQTQTQQETQPNQTQKGGEAMIYFVTFTSKVSAEKAKEVLVELRRRFPTQTAIFTPKPPNGRRLILNIAGVTVIITFPKNPNKQEQAKEQASQSPTQGFTLGELIKSKKT